MPIHIEADKKDISQVIILVGNPQRAEFYAENYLIDVKKYNDYRLMYGYTGFYKDKKISIQTTGMGSPSMSIMIEELIMLEAKTLIRLGTCGSINDKAVEGDIILPTAAHSSHNIFSQTFNNAAFSAAPDFLLAKGLYESALNKNIPVKTGSVLTSEVFYEETFDLYKKFSKYDTLAVEMEVYPLNVIANKHNIKSGSLLTVSDIVFEQRRADKSIIKNGTKQMIEITLDMIDRNYEYLTT